ncbi:phosphate acyltransferase PlsX [Maritimibacter fusiformis]|uniref:Phosphate acyltransferase n=1 Tax=Maritimibacter fusiformis TaxID=2603819 RepID=A0A5D0RIV2_9RHOB|nr:phosphate acyltransferase PlsX [Maritimibacter fusiformis]TYB81353.1 phosphate acyltransferase PlsX [Maritimibacter fusiformis]
MAALTELNKTGTVPAGTQRIVVSVDAMGGDLGPATVVAGLAMSARANPGIAFILHGDRAELDGLVAKHPELAGRCDVRHAEGVVTMDDKPAQVLRSGKNTSMWSAIDAVRDKEAEVCVSCGNTGALMVLSMMRLRKLPGINRPAIACYWPSTNPGGFNVMLDVGADVRADEMDLMQYALMGVSFARNSLGLARPRVGLLNVGTEDHKGRSEIKAAAELIQDAAESGTFEFIGNVEGSDIPSDKVDVVVTDGFTGNVALKTAEGTAHMFKGFLKAAFTATPLSRLAAMFASTSLKRLSARMDPRRVNGGVFLGLTGTVVKSHGSADPTGIAAAVQLAHDLARSGFNDKLAARVAYVPVARQDDADKDAEQDTASK